jgi:hypothetical protein
MLRRTLIRLSVSRGSTFHGHGNRRRFSDAVLSVRRAAVVRQRPVTRLLIFPWCGRPGNVPRRPAPNPHADSGGPAPKGGRLCQGQGPAGPDTRSFPTPRPLEGRLAQLLAKSVPLGKARGRGGSSVHTGFLKGGGPAGVGGRWDGHAPSPFFVGQLHADPVSSPGPPPGPGPVVRPPRSRSRARPASHQTGRIPGLRPWTPGAGSRPQGRGCRRAGWPRWLPLGLGSLAAPWLSGARSGRYQRPPSSGACGRTPAPACAPARPGLSACPSGRRVGPGAGRCARPSGR